VAFGLLNVAKPSGPTSHDVVNAVRRGTGERRVGHGGTLDPLADGVLVLALGRATRLLEYLSASRKAYRAEVTLGVTTDTYDAEGEVLAERPVPPDLTLADLDSALDAFRGAIQQVPPVYSAVKVGGKAAYARARAGEELELEPREVQIFELEAVAFEPPRVVLRVVCSAGTYIRSLAHDLGEALGTGAMLSALTRTASGQFRLEDAVRWPDLETAFADGSWRDLLLPADLALDGTPQLHLDEQGLQDISYGRPLRVGDAAARGLARAYAPDGRFVAVLEGDARRGFWRPKKVFV